MRLAFWRNWPLAAQLTLTMATLVAIAVTLITVLYVDREQANARAELQRQAEVILITLVTTQANALYVLDTDALETAMEALGDAQTGVLARVYDSEGRLVADSAQQQSLVFGLEPDAFGQELVHNEDLLTRWQPGYFEVGRVVVVGNEPIGAISLQITTLGLEGTLQAAREQGLLLAAAAVGIGIGVSLLVSRAITRPLQQISSVAQRISDGDLSIRAAITGQQETGRLAQAFNNMLDAIQKRDTERTQLINDLQVAKHQAQESSRLKSEFLATMSHELRTPLNAVIGFSGIILEGMAGEVDEQAKSMISAIYDSSQHLLGLINSILDIAKIEAGRLEIVAQPMSLAEAARDWRDRLGVLAERKNLRFDVNLAPDLPDMILCDNQRLTQIAANLISNAVKFTEQGSVQVSVEWQDERLKLVVRDTGVGIPPHALAYIFEEFRQVDGTYQRAHGGTGLGLAIVRKLCQAMGGQVTVDSTLGQGSTFTVVLPAPVAMEAAVA